jgi:hypothetical protein
MSLVLVMFLYSFSVVASRKVIGGRKKGQKKKRQHQQSSHSRELITVIACVSANGVALPPTVIFRGKNIYADWIEDNPLNAQCVHCP